MALQIGIIGLPNVGKSTMFNALTGTQSAQAANYPFCTIDPNVGIVEVPDERLDQIGQIFKPEKIIPTVIEFVDIAGLVKGASEGEGLGNKFLSHIRECDAIAQVVRFFEDDNITHVHNQINPQNDIEIVETELILADLQTVSRQLDRAKTQAKSGQKEDKLFLELIEKLNQKLSEGKPAREISWSEEEKKMLRPLHLISMKPIMYIANIDESQIKKVNIPELIKKTGRGEHTIILPISAKIESELGGFSKLEADEFLKELGLTESGLKNLIKAAYKLLGLQTFFTAGPKEVRAWTIEQGSKAPQAGGKIHSDFEKGFIRADIYHVTHLLDLKSETKIREKGLLRSEGKEYTVQDGDVIHFHFN